MKYIYLKEKDLQELCEHYDIGISIFEKYGGAILYEDGSLYPYNSYYFPCPIYEGLEEDYQYFIEQGYTPID